MVQPAARRRRGNCDRSVSPKPATESDKSARCRTDFWASWYRRIRHGCLSVRLTAKPLPICWRPPWRKDTKPKLCCQGRQQFGVVPIGGPSFGVSLATRLAVVSKTSCNNVSRIFLVGIDLTRIGFAGCPRLMKRSLSCRIESMLDSSCSKTGNAFHRNGPMWVVWFKGHGTSLENNVGPLFIARLLATPSRAVPAITLLASRLFGRSVFSTS